MLVQGDGPSTDSEGSPTRWPVVSLTATPDVADDPFDPGTAASTTGVAYLFASSLLPQRVRGRSRRNHEAMVRKSVTKVAATTRTTSFQSESK